MKLFLLGLVALPTLLMASPPAAQKTGPRVLENEHISLTVKSKGAVISDLHWKQGGVNWLSPEKPNSDGMYAHFLCYDRWGRVTPDEAKLGIPFHGEAVQQIWSSVSSEPFKECQSVTLPVVKLRADRSLRLAKQESAFLITTTFENPTAETRPYNAVEHVTLSPQGYAEETKMFTNASRGFVQFNGKWLRDSTFHWPQLELAGKDWNLRDWVRVKGMLITSLVFEDDEPWGWAGVENPTTGEILGYVWSTRDYPWLMFWTHYKNGRVINRAIEPGTTGLHRPLGELTTIPPILDRDLVQYLKPGEQKTRHLWGFVLKRPAHSLTQINQVYVEANTVVIKLNDGKEVHRLPIE